MDGRARNLLIRAAAITAAVGVPVAVLLAYLAWLPYLIGLFFWLLGGLLVGAFFYRLASACRPYPVWPVRAAVGAVVALMFATAMLTEYYVKRSHLSRDLALAAARKQKISPQQWADLLLAADAHVRAQLGQYGPGAIGYWVWAALDGRISGSKDLAGVEVTLSQRRLGWVFRVVLSAVFLAMGVLSQAVDLTRLESIPVEQSEPDLREDAPCGEG